MYQVVIMHGDNEPWWFFEDWRKDICFEQQFESEEQAIAFYQGEWTRLMKEYPERSAKPNYLAAFWKAEDERWCEECDDYLQQYTGLALLKDYQPLTETSSPEFYQELHGKSKCRVCNRPQHFTNV
ncbi:DUF1033 family protein [Enterococcus asini]|uniref:DUF1033 family protein n=1 Tax=Enterococcus asini TaxID=57732 RepID=UPI00289274DB|nr:DUF1033 family protein [Enterococcus asini]MDT2755813.1 DUF1033 family protein [Enterococcus asini]